MARPVHRPAWTFTEQMGGQSGFNWWLWTQHKMRWYSDGDALWLLVALILLFAEAFPFWARKHKWKFEAYPFIPMKNEHSCIGWVSSFGRRPFPSFLVSVQYADQAREDYEHGKVVWELSTRGMGITGTDDWRLPRSVSSGSGLHRLRWLHFVYCGLPKLGSMTAWLLQIFCTSPRESQIWNPSHQSMVTKVWESWFQSKWKEQRHEGAGDQSDLCLFVICDSLLACRLFRNFKKIL